ncbi:MAG: hypothetical protein ACXVCX_07390 [Ktedonobacterales bacterium]
MMRLRSMPLTISPLIVMIVTIAMPVASALYHIHAMTATTLTEA